MTLHISLDIETYGINSKAPVLAIGACRIDFDAQRLYDTFYRVIDFEDAWAHGVPDASTAKWWMKQSDAARQALLRPGVKLKDGLNEFAAYYYTGVGADDNPPILWCNGPSFDTIILDHAYTACGLRSPWPYNAPRDFRTMRTIGKELLGVNIANSSDVASHKADEDAAWQAAQILAVWTMLRTNSKAASAYGATLLANAAGPKPALPYDYPPC